MDTIVKKVIPTNSTMDKIGVTKDPIQAIFEYIRNGFDAWATKIDINFTTEVEIEDAGTIKIIDNWIWIPYEDFDNKFIPLLDSTKMSNIRGINIHWKKWRWRFSFWALAENIERDTTYIKKQQSHTYKITASSTSKENFHLSEAIISNKWQAWTIVTLSNISWIRNDELSDPYFAEKIKREFWRYLELHKETVIYTSTIIKLIMQVLLERLGISLIVK